MQMNSNSLINYRSRLSQLKRAVFCAKTKVKNTDHNLESNKANIIVHSEPVVTALVETMLSLTKFPLLCLQQKETDKQ